MVQDQQPHDLLRERDTTINGTPKEASYHTTTPQTDSTQTTVRSCQQTTLPRSAASCTGSATCHASRYPVHHPPQPAAAVNTPSGHRQATHYCLAMPLLLLTTRTGHMAHSLSTTQPPAPTVVNQQWRRGPMSLQHPLAKRCSGRGRISL